MSILIKGMEMPTSCLECQLNYDMYKCVLTGKSTMLADDYRLNDCPLIELPPHGRLIDADAAMKQGWVIQRNYRKTLTDSVIEIRHIAELPTIIESEEEDG